jgi:hypothetical protein
MNIEEVAEQTPGTYTYMCAHMNMYPPCVCVYVFVVMKVDVFIFQHLV